MKGFLIFASLLLTIQVAYTFDAFAYQQGFAHQVELTEEQNYNANQCLYSAEEIVRVVKSLSNDKLGNPAFMIVRLYTLFNQFKTQIIRDCSPYLSDLAALSHQKSQGLPLKTRVVDNYNKYSSYVIREATKWLDALSKGDQDYKAGQIQGYIIQILLGTEQPHEYPEIPVDETKFTPFEFKDFAEQFDQVFYNSIGVKDQETINLQKQCAMKVYNKTMDLILLSLNSTQWNNVENQVDGAKIVSDLFLETAKPCITAVKALKPFLAPFLKTFDINPLAAIAEVAHQVGINQPEIAFAKDLMKKYVYEGDYKKTGKVAAEIVNLITQNLGW